MSFDEDSIEFLAYDDGDVYVVEYVGTVASVYRTDWTFNKRTLLWSQSAAEAQISSAMVGGDVIALDRTEFVEEPGSKGTLQRVNTDVIVVRTDGSNGRSVATGSTLTRPTDERLYRVPAECGSRVDAAAVTNSGTVFIQRSTATRKGAVCKGTRNINEYRIERLETDGSFRPHFVMRERISTRNEVDNGSIALFGSLSMSTSGDTGLIDDGRRAVLETLDEATSRTTFRSRLHRLQGHSFSKLLDNGNIVMEDFRWRKRLSKFQTRIYVMSDPKLRPVRIGRSLSEPEAEVCGDSIAVWENSDWGIKRNRVLIYAADGTYRRAVNLPKRTLVVGCTRNRVISVQFTATDKFTMSTQLIGL